MLLSVIGAMFTFVCSVLVLELVFPIHQRKLTNMETSLPTNHTDDSTDDIEIRLLSNQTRGAYPPNKKTQRAEQEAVRVAFNARILTLSETIKNEIQNIAAEFSTRGPHRSEDDVRSQVMYRLATEKRQRKPSTYNAWNHAQAAASKLESESNRYIPCDSASD
jgi:hypothetical protein